MVVTLAGSRTLAEAKVRSRHFSAVSRPTGVGEPAQRYRNAGWLMTGQAVRGLTTGGKPPVHRRRGRSAARPCRRSGTSRGRAASYGRVQLTWKPTRLTTTA